MNDLLAIVCAAAILPVPAPSADEGAGPIGPSGASGAALGEPTSPAATSSPAEPTAAQRAWLAANAVPLTSLQAGQGFADLEPLRAMIGSARVVGLGEGTHGTREFFQAKHRLLEFLVTEMGFSIFAIEANMPECAALNDYVLGGEGDVKALIRGMYFWTWNTEEVRDMVEWMRAHNARQRAAGAPDRVLFTGFDMQTGKVALGIVMDFLRQHDPAFLESISAKLDALREFSPHASGGSGFGCATGRFPVADVRGRHVRFSGWIRTEGVDDAWAGLWWRVDGPTPKFDNMMDRGPRGTTDWQEVSIEMDVPEDAKAIYFGLVKPGNGKAWFDALAVEVDGKPWNSPEAQARFDFDFEGPQPQGIIAADPMRGPASPQYPGALDGTVAKSGASSFRLERIETQGEFLPREAIAVAGSVLEHLRSQREGLLRTADPEGLEWAIANARVVQQWAQLARPDGNGFAHRDECMAENALWILERHPGARMVIWAHNWHVRDEAPFMGSHLRRALGTDYVNLAFCASRGEYQAISADGRGLADHRLAEPPPGSVEAIIEAADTPILLLDLRRTSKDDPGSAWLTEQRPFGGIIGAMEMAEHYQPALLKGPFDLLLYIRDTTAARRLR